MINSTLLYLGGIGFQEIFFLLIPVVLWLWALIDLVTSNFANITIKLIWTLIILFVPFIGAILYLTVGRKQKTSSAT